MCRDASRLALLIVLCVGTPLDAAAGGVFVDAAGVRSTKRVRSLLEIRQAGVVRQKWDLSCGSAALSTLLTHDHGDPTPESAIIVSILRRTDPVKVKSRGGFSLLDLKRFVEARGYRAKGYAGLAVADLVGFGVPAIVPIRVKGYDHFVVFRGVRGDRVVLADPAFGNVTMRIDRFKELWKNGIGFVVLRRGPAPPGPRLDAEALPIPDAAVVARSLRVGGAAPPARLGP